VFFCLCALVQFAVFGVFRACVARIVIAAHGVVLLLDLGKTEIGQLDSPVFVDQNIQGHCVVKFHRGKRRMEERRGEGGGANSLA